MEDMENTHKILVGKPGEERREHLEVLDLDGRENIKMNILK